MPSYFKRYYLDDVKLAQRALLEFHRSLRSGRMIAFTGAMTTESCGYGTWDDLIETYARIGDAIWGLLRGDEDPVNWKEIEDLILLIGRKKFDYRNPTIDKMRTYTSSGGKKLDARVLLGLVEEVVLEARRGGGQQLPQLAGSDLELDVVRNPSDILSILMARYFRKPHRRKKFDKALEFMRKRKDSGGIDCDIVGKLINELGIHRFATLNYDFEIEARLMLGGEVSADGPFKDLRKLRDVHDSISWDCESGLIRRVLTNGLAVESDILNRDRIDRMFEFAIGADDVDRHVLHMHGRACRHKSMILSYRDYDHLYRTNDLSKLPFEFAQRVLIGGNPVVFVGVGMSEQEVNETLEDFVSASPYQRMAPTFLLWNNGKTREDMLAAQEDGPGGTKQRYNKVWHETEMRRLDWFHRLGVLTIFDSDLPSSSAIKSPNGDQPHAIITTPIAGSPPSLADRAAAVNNLGWLVRNVGPAAALVAQREDCVNAKSWRHLGAAIADCAGTESEPDSKRPMILWEVQRGGSDLDTRPQNIEERTRQISKKLAETIASGSSLLGVIGSPGCGHGRQTFELTDRAAELGIDADHILLVNACFSFDTDSILDGVARFIDRHRREWLTKEARYLDPESDSPVISRGTFFENLTLCAGSTPPQPAPPRVLIVINGLERMYGLSGTILSSEFDELLFYAAQGMPDIVWVLFGTRRVRHDFVQRKIAVFDPEASGEATLDQSESTLPVRRYEAIHKAFDNVLRSDTDTKVGRWAEATDRARQLMLEQAGRRFVAHSTGQTRGDGMELRRAFYDLYLGDGFDKAIGKMAIGKKAKEVKGAAGVTASLAREILRALAFIGLPTEIAVLRHCPRVRRLSGDRKTLAAAIDCLIELGLVIQIRGYPDPGNQKPLENRFALPRTLLTELRYRFSVPLSEAKLSTAFNMSLYVAQPVDGYIPETEIHDELGDMIDRLIGCYRELAREADAPGRHVDDGPVRDALLAKIAEILPHERAIKGKVDRRGDTRQPVDLVDELFAVCSQDYAQCLRSALALVRGYYTTTDLLTLDVGDRLIREDRDGVLLEHAERLDCLIDAYGKVAMTRELLRQELLSRNEELPDGFGKIEPFYPDEIVWLHNERGVVRLAMGDLIEAATSFDRAFEVNRRFVERQDRAHNWRRIQLNQLTVDVERGDLVLAMSKARDIIALAGRRGELREDQLASAVARGYQARILHLQGDEVGAKRSYELAIAPLAALKEYRCQAYFLRLRAELGGNTASEDMSVALQLANATRQMDIVYRLRIMIAQAVLEGREMVEDGEVIDRSRAQRMLDYAIRYALQTEMHRIRVEAGAAQADARLRSGDYEGALRHVSDAMMVATRFGMELRKIYLRSLTGRIMGARGHPITAQNLALTTIRIASRRRYEMGIDHAEATLMKLPRVSSITEVVDASMRRQL